MGQIVRSFGRIVMAVVAACGTVVAAQGTAHAAWAFNDNMEIHFGVPPQNRFSFDSNTNWRGSFIFSPQNEEQSSEAHSPSHYAYLSTGSAGLTWTSVGRSVTIPAAPNGGRRTCQFHAWVRAGFQQFNIEVIDPATWDYITVKKVRSPMWTWDVISTNNFTAASTVFVRVALLSPGYTATARVDDFTVLCS